MDMMMGDVLVAYPPSTKAHLLSPSHLSDWAAPSSSSSYVAVEDEATAPSHVIRETIKRQIDSGVEDAFFVVDLGAVVRQHKKWVRNLPRVVSQGGKGGWRLWD